MDGGTEIGDFIISARSSKAKCLLCDGGAYSRAAYARLFAEIGTKYGAGDGSTTFNVPDPRGRALVIAGTGLMEESFAAAAVTVATDLITVQSNVDRWITGMKVSVSTTGTLPAGLVSLTDYYVIRASATTIKLATTLANAVAGTAIDLTAQGSGTHTLTHTHLQCAPLATRAARKSTQARSRKWRRIGTSFGAVEALAEPSQPALATPLRSLSWAIRMRRGHPISIRTTASR